MKKISFVIGNHLMKRKNIETTLTRFICLLLSILFISVIFLYYFSIQKMYSEQLAKSNDSIIQQVAISFETMMKQITDSIYKIPLYENDLLQLLRSNEQNALFQGRDIYKKLDSILLGNEYLYSSYLYSSEQNLVFISESGNSYNADSFFDKAAITAAKREEIIVLGPRFIDTNQGRKLVISVISPLPLSPMDYEGVLVVNIDASKLYYDILKKINAEENMDFYVYDPDHTIILHKNEAFLFKKVMPEEVEGSSSHNSFSLRNFFNKSMVIQSSYYSKTLHWNFVLKTTIKSASNFLTKLYTFTLYFAVMLLLSLFIVILIIKYSTKPMKKVISNYNEKLWRDFLTDNNVDPDELQKLLSPDNSSFIPGGAFAAIVLQILKPEFDQNEFHQFLDDIRSFAGVMETGYTTNTIVINKNQTAVIVNFNQGNRIEESESKLAAYAELLYNSLNACFKPVTYFGVSSIKESVDRLPMTYMECVESLNYKMICNSHILHYTDIKDRHLSYEYPYKLEKQLINNLIVGNSGACNIFLEKFFGKLTDAAFCLSDSEIKNYVYQLQTSVLRNISGLPISVKIDSSVNILNLFNFNEIKTKVSDFVGKIVSEVNKKDKNEELSLVNRVFEYFEANFMNEDFNLNIMADELNLNRNYLTKIIKEKSGNNFNDYTNIKRILLAKKLLNDKQIIIDDIAHQVGFNSANYFIKVFKNIEGITPGQYRDKTSYIH